MIGAQYRQPPLIIICTVDFLLSIFQDSILRVKKLQYQIVDRLHPPCAHCEDHEQWKKP